MITATGDSRNKAKAEDQDEKDFLAKAMERFQLCAEAEEEWRKEALDDFDFYDGKQWPDDIRNSREGDGRPCLTNNRLPQFVKQVTNEQRQQRPGINVNPVGDGADVDTAEVIQGVVRHIEVISDAETAYDLAFEHMVIGGRGYWRVITDYFDDESFEQEIFIRAILNPFAVYFDPGCQMLDKSDGRFCFVIKDMSPEEYKNQFPDSELAGADEYQSTGNAPAQWISKDNIRVAEYFYVEESQVKLSKGGKTRMVNKREVKWALINGVEILDQKDWIGKWLPIVPVTGDELLIDGKVRCKGLIRNAKDPQRQYNYMESAATEAIALAPKAPFIVAEGQIEGYESMWVAANTRNMAFLTYKQVDIGGKPAPPPQRSSVEPPIQAMAVMIRQADNDLKAVTGIYDASLGEKGPDQSAKAILTRQKQSDIANLNYSDNLKRSIAFTGRQVVDLIPKVYESRQIVRIVKPDGTSEMVHVSNSTREQ